MKNAFRHQPITLTPHLTQLGTRSFPAYLSMGKAGMVIEGGTGPTTDIIVDQLEHLKVDPAQIRYIMGTQRNSWKVHSM